METDRSIITQFEKVGAKQTSDWANSEKSCPNTRPRQIGKKQHIVTLVQSSLKWSTFPSSSHIPSLNTQIRILSHDGGKYDITPPIDIIEIFEWEWASAETQEWTKIFLLEKKEELWAFKRNKTISHFFPSQKNSKKTEGLRWKLKENLFFQWKHFFHFSMNSMRTHAKRKSLW